MTTEERIRTAFDKWVPIFGLDDWHINIELAPKSEELDQASDGLDAAATCWANWEYEVATIRFAEDELESADDRLLEKHVIHELLHCVLSTWREKQNQHKFEERATVYLTRAFQKVAA